MFEFPNGVWPVMLTPFTQKNTIDYPALKALVNWYIDSGVAGLFAVCQSSELFFLTAKERQELSAAVLEYAGGRVPVIVGGQSSTQLVEQLRETEEIASTSPAAVILLTNQFDTENGNDELWWDNMQRFLDKAPADITFGLYECPYPYKRVLSAELLGKCARSGRFKLMKDTCCDGELISHKLEAISGTGFKLFNANTATLLRSLKDGASGYSGVMANFHPQLYVWLCKNYARYPEQAAALQNVLTMCSYIEKQYYPVNAKYAMSLSDVMGTYSRVKDDSLMTDTFKDEVRQLLDLSQDIAGALKRLK